MSLKAISIYADALKRHENERQSNPTRESTQKVTWKKETSSDNPRELSRGLSREFPSRDEIQEFSFRLRDTLKVKVQAEVPHTWHKELEEIARQLDVKKLELYRFILGEFLGKVKSKNND